MWVMYRVYYSVPKKRSWKYWYSLIQAHSKEEALEKFKKTRTSEWHKNIKVHGVGDVSELPPVTWKPKRKSLGSF